MTEISLDSWEGLARLAGTLDAGDTDFGAYAFRGQADAAWDLEPTLVRIFRHVETTEERALDIEKRALRQFQAQADLYIDTNTKLNTTDVVSWWTLMRHHGAPTRLLDWSRSLYVATYFAVSSHPESPGAVWLASSKAMNDYNAQQHQGDDSWPRTPPEMERQFLEAGAPRVLFFTERRSMTDRMAAQRGLFSICRNPLAVHGDILRSLHQTEGKQAFVRKLMIPAHLKAVFLRNLISMNINARTLYPGLDGLSRSIGEFIQVMAQSVCGNAKQGAQKAGASDGVQETPEAGK